MTEPGPEIYRFGGHTLDARERRLLGNGAAIPLKPRAFDTLLYLVERAGHLVPKEELLAQLWPSSIVEESTLAKNVWLVRRALAEIVGSAATGGSARSGQSSASWPSGRSPPAQPASIPNPVGRAELSRRLRPPR